MRSELVHTLAVRVLGVLLAFVSTTITARVLGPEQFGAWSAGLSLATLLASLAPLGMDRVLVRQLSIISSHTERAAELAIAHRCAVRFGGLLLAVGVLAGIGCRLLGWNDWSRTLLLSSLLLTPLTLTWLRQWAAIPLMGTRLAVLPEQVLIPAGTIAVFLVLHWQQVPLSATAAAVIFCGLSLLIWVWSTLRGSLGQLYSAAFQGRHASTVTLQPRVIEGMQFLPMAIGPMLCQRITPLVVGACCGFEEIAHFSYALLITGIPAIPLGMLSLSLIPPLARMHHSQDTSGQQRLAENTATASALIAVLLSALILPFAPLIPQLLDPRYAPVPTLLPALLLAMLADCATGPTFSVMQTLGLERAYSQLLVTLVPLQMLLIFWFGSLASVQGAALGYFAGRVIWNVGVVLVIHRRRGLLLLPSLRSLKFGWQCLQGRESTVLTSGETDGSGLRQAA
ncbi:MAG: lipopolysaccharide biosynthesis protein [Planctomycetota bacterium]